LQRTKRVFAHSSYAEASTAELARASEVTEPLLYKHFGSKKGLFLAVLTQCGAQFRDTLHERLQRRAAKDSLGALAHVVEEYRAATYADPETQRVLFQAVSESSDPEIARCISGHNRAVFEMIRQLAEQARHDGHLDPALSPDAAAWGYMSMILALQYSVMLDLLGDMAAVQEEVSRVWLRGLRAGTG
jgi:AcrR family transcriptional regulator